MRVAACVAALVIAAAVASGVAADGPAPPPEPRPAVGLRTLAFDCASGGFTVILLAGHATVLLSDRGATVPQVAVDRYSDGYLSLALIADARQATLRLGSGSTRLCVGNPRRALEERARIRGTALSAVARDGSWTLEVVPDEAELPVVQWSVAAEPMQRFTVSSIRGAPGRGAGVIAGERGRKSLIIEVAVEPCRDSASGALRSLTFRVTNGDHTTIGCGDRYENKN